MSIYAPRSAFRLNRKDARKRSQLNLLKGQHTFGVRFNLSKSVDRLLRVLELAESDEVDTVTSTAIRVVSRDFAEQLDGADELLRAGSVGPAKVVGRTCIELAATVRYLVAKNDERVSAAMFLHSFKSAEEAANTFLDPERILEDYVKDLRKARINHEYSSQPNFEAASALDELPRGCPWYGVLSGPTSIAQLLRVAGLGVLYDRYYVPWSSVVHGLRRVPSEASGKKLGIRPLRDFGPEVHGCLVAFLDALGDLLLWEVAHYFSPRKVGAEVVEESLAALISFPGDFPFG